MIRGLCLGLILACQGVLLAGELWAQSGDWWKETVVYQIYPRSFQDSDGDGVGDLQGIIDRLDALQALGVETIWISPFFESPWQDFGYDISDYRRVDPVMGDSATLERLIGEVHERKMKVVFDLVMNHSSVEHEWFRSSAADSSGPYGDWYVWAEGRRKGKRPPNNWRSTIGGSGWHYHPGRGQWYFSSFLPFQPDFNYHNPAVRQALLDVARHWLRQGVDGFRLDIFNVIYHDSLLRPNPFSLRLLPNAENPNGFFQRMKHTVNHPENYGFASELRTVVDSGSQGEAFVVGEVFGDHEAVARYMGGGTDGLHLTFQFDLLNFKYKARFFAKKIATYKEHYPDPLMPTLVFSNHDRIRMISRADNDPKKARLISTFQLTARGVPFIYQGEEIGMRQADIPLSEALDPLAKKYDWLPQWLANMSTESLNRDNCRTPMQWDNTIYAGFCPDTTEPWLPVTPGFNKINVARQRAESSSLWQHYRELIHLRQSNCALRRGDIALHKDLCSRHILAYTRSCPEQQVLVVLNFGNKRKAMTLKEKDIRVLYSSSPGQWAENGDVVLEGHGALVVEFTQP